MTEPEPIRVHVTIVPSEFHQRVARFLETVIDVEIFDCEEHAPTERQPMTCPWCFFQTEALDLYREATGG